LGQSKDPFAINKHINKFFPGIRRLDFTNMQMHAKTEAEKKWSVTDIYSPDGEKVILKEQ
jgi:hypothetical protein